MLGEGEFDVSVSDDGLEVWVTQMGGYMNMNTAFIDRDNGIAVIVDPFDSKRWVEALAIEDLFPTHLIYTHTHRDHTAGYSMMLNLVPDVEVWGHEEARVPNLLGHMVFKKVDFTHTWNNDPNTTVEWSAGSITLGVTHSPGHAPGHVTLHGHGVYHAGDLLFTAQSGRVDLPGSNPRAQWESLQFARELLRGLSGEWRLIPGHRYEWIDGSTPDWVSVEQALAHNFALNSPQLNAFKEF